MKLNVVRESAFALLLAATSGCDSQANAPLVQGPPVASMTPVAGARAMPPTGGGPSSGGAAGGVAGLGAMSAASTGPAGSGAGSAASGSGGAGVGVSDGAGSSASSANPPAAGSGGDTAAAGAAGTSEAPRMDQGKGDGKDVITIGDSWMLLMTGSGIEVSLERSAMNDYRNYAVPGTRIDAIIDQYAQAKAENPNIQTVVMTGGGNDVLQPAGAIMDCGMLNMTCRTIIEEVRTKIAKLWNDMAADKVQDVFIIQYSRAPNDAWDLKGAVELSTMLTKESCAMVPAPLRCTLIDAVPIFGDENYIRGDNIHPTDEGFDLLGAATYKTMVEAGARR